MLLYPHLAQSLWCPAWEDCAGYGTRLLSGLWGTGGLPGAVAAVTAACTPFPTVSRNVRVCMCVCVCCSPGADGESLLILPARLCTKPCPPKEQSGGPLLGEAQPAPVSHGDGQDCLTTICRKEAAFSTGFSTYTGMWKTRMKKYEGLGPALWCRVIPARTEHGGTGAGVLLPAVCPNNPVWPVLRTCQFCSSLGMVN